MKALLVPFRQLVERRLWPVALLLVAALAAVPVVLASDVPAGGGHVAAGEPRAAVPGATKPIVSVADAARTEAERRVLGARKDPFRPAVKGTPAKVRAGDAGSGSAPSRDAGDAGAAAEAVSGAPSGGSTPAPAGGTEPPTAAAPAAPDAPRPVYELHALQVRFGLSSGALRDRVLKRLTGLPGGRRPAVLYLGLAEDRRTAVFLVDGTAQVRGDGRCEPRPDDCQTLRLRAGDTVFIDTAAGRQYQLDLRKIHTRRTADAAEARAARASEARSGRAALRRNAHRIGPYRYSARAGVLKVSRTRERR